MKNIIILITLILISFSCSLSLEDTDIQTIKDTILETNKNIDIGNWDKKTGWQEYWQTPEETLRWKKGDCEDIVILCVEKLRKKGYDCNLAVNYIKGHAKLEYNTYLFECTMKSDVWITNNSVEWYTIIGDIDSEIPKHRY